MVTWVKSWVTFEGALIDVGHTNKVEAHARASTLIISLILDNGIYKTSKKRFFLIFFALRRKKKAKVKN